MRKFDLFLTNMKKSSPHSKNLNVIYDYFYKNISYDELAYKYHSEWLYISKCIHILMTKFVW